MIRRPKLPVALGALVALAGALTLAAVPSPAAAAPCEMLARLAQPSALAAAPQIVFQAPPEGSRLRDRVNLGVSTPASAGFTRVEFFLDDQLVATETAGPTDWCTDIDLRGKPHGAHITISAQPWQGDSTTTPPLSRGYFIDRLASAAFTSPTPVEGDVTSGTPVVAFTTDPDVTARECRTTRDGVVGPWTPCASPYTPPTPEDGSYAVEVHVTDDLGNAATIRRRFGVDRHPPVVTITAPADGSFINHGFTPAFDADGGVPSCALDGGEFGPCVPVGLLPDGRHKLQVKSRDAAGQVSAIATSEFTVDATPPAAAITSGPPQNAILAEPAAGFGFTASDANPLTRSCGLDLAVPGPCDGPDRHSYASLADGPHRFTLWATDAAGNRTEVTRGFTVNAVKPGVAITDGPPDGAALAQTSATFRFASAGAVDVACSLDSETAFGPCTGPESHTAAGLADGEHVFRVRARDESDDVAVAARTFRVDTSAPDTLIDAGPREGSRTPADRVTFAFHASAPGSTFRCRLGGAPFGPCSGPGATHHAARLRPGAYAFEVQAVNALGTPDTTPARRRFTLLRPLPPLRVANLWSVWPTRTRVRDLTVKSLPTRSRVTVSCHGRGCPFKLRRGRPRRGAARLAPHFGRADLSPGTRVDVRVAVRDAAWIVRFTMRPNRLPRRTNLCVAPGSKRPKRC